MRSFEEDPEVDETKEEMDLPEPTLPLYVSSETRFTNLIGPARSVTLTIEAHSTECHTYLQVRRESWSGLINDAVALNNGPWHGSLLDDPTTIIEMRSYLEACGVHPSSVISILAFATAVGKSLREG